MMPRLEDLKPVLDATDWLLPYGMVRSSRGMVLSCHLPAGLGDQCLIRSARGKEFSGEVVGFHNDQSFVVLYEEADEVAPGMMVINRGQSVKVPVGAGLLGRIFDGLGRPIDEKGPLRGCQSHGMMKQAPSALKRTRIRDVFVTGQRAIDGMLTLGRGQRVGIFAGSGVGKSTLLGEIAKGSNADVNVIALIGERGREVGPFLEDCLGSEGLARSVVVIATCDQTPLMRVRAAQYSLAIADWFRTQGLHVLLMVDSITRLAMAQRELGLALGEPPSARSYTPSVFRLLANFVEGMGTAAQGSITGVLTVLVEGDDLDEPITDSVRSFVDGHIVLERKLAEAHHYPAINIAKSISRVASDLVTAGHLDLMRKVRAMMATYAEVEDLIRIGAYQRGSMAMVDRAIDLRPQLLEFLRQKVNDRTPFAQTVERMARLTAEWKY